MAGCPREGCPPSETAVEALEKAARAWSTYPYGAGIEELTSKAQSATLELTSRLAEAERLLASVKVGGSEFLFQQLPVVRERFVESLERDLFCRVDRMELMVARIRSDLDRLEAELTEAEATVVAVPADSYNLASFVPYLLEGSRSIVETGSVLLNRSAAAAAAGTSTSALASSSEAT